MSDSGEWMELVQLLTYGIQNIGLDNVTALNRDQGMFFFLTKAHATLTSFSLKELLKVLLRFLISHFKCQTFITNLFMASS